MEKTKLNISGMSCGHCKQAVTEALTDLDGISSVEVNLDAGNAEVEYDASKVSLDKMKEAVEDQGYDVE